MTEELVGSIDQMNLELRAPRFDRNRSVGVSGHSLDYQAKTRSVTDDQTQPSDERFSTKREEGLGESRRGVSQATKKWPRTKPRP